MKITIENVTLTETGMYKLSNEIGKMSNLFERDIELRFNNVGVMVMQLPPVPVITNIEQLQDDLIDEDEEDCNVFCANPDIVEAAGNVVETEEELQEKL